MVVVVATGFDTESWLAWGNWSTGNFANVSLIQQLSMWIDEDGWEGAGGFFFFGGGAFSVSGVYEPRIFILYMRAALLECFTDAARKSPDIQVFCTKTEY